MKIAIIGSGNIGGGLARAWRKHGHAITFGAHNVGRAELQVLCKEIGASAVPVRDAVAHAEVVVFAMPAKAMDDVVGAAEYAGKIVIDCTNAVAPGMQLVYGHTTSAAEELAKKLPSARVFKSFNAQGAENLANPVYDGVRATNFFCGDDPEGKRIVRQLVEDVGFEAVDAGGLTAARLIEPLMLLWVSCSRSLGTRDIAFKLLRRS
ncbi:MAG TPA: NAD(P)-binding domain-containing protein [Kofleriaceae bacterium]|nr:NAD(P)-binding domain-containing protein [Kofleriaceae bacterium]